MFTRLCKFNYKQFILTDSFNATKKALILQVHIIQYLPTIYAVFSLTVNFSLCHIFVAYFRLINVGPN